MGSDAFRAPHKTIWNLEPDSPSGPGTTKLVQRTVEAPKRVPGSLTDPLDAAVAVDGQLGGLGGDTAPWRLARKGGGPGRGSLAETHLGCFFPWDEVP